MKENTDLSRRSFLTKGAAVASIIAIPNLAANVHAAGKPTAPMPGTPVDTDSAQTLTNKTISSVTNILGTDTRNIKEFLVSGTDITDALNDAIDELGFNGGRILIPRGVWQTDGGHVVTNSITIEGIGICSGIFTVGSVIELNPKANGVMFTLLTPTRNVTFKDFGIDLTANPDATGILMTDIGGTSNYIYNTYVDNVGIYGGAFGIKVDTSKGNYESNLNYFEKVCFVGCRTSFYNNTINSGFTFENCHFYLPYDDNERVPGGTALDCYVVGNLTLKHCVFVGSQPNGALVAPTDGSTILKTTGLFNTINFYDCQDENVEFAYQNDVNAWYAAAIVYRNCLIQSKLVFTADGSVVMDSCRCAGKVIDTSTGAATLYLKGHWNFYGYDPIPPHPQITVESAESHVDFTNNANSRILYEKLEVTPTIKTVSDMSGGAYTVHNRRGAVEVAATTSYVQVYNNNVTVNSLVFLQLRSYDSGGAKLRGDVTTYNGSFLIALTQAAASDLSVGFIVEG